MTEIEMISSKKNCDYADTDLLSDTGSAYTETEAGRHG